MGNYENDMVYTGRREGRKNRQNGCNECGTWNDAAEINNCGCEACEWDAGSACEQNNDCECSVTTSATGSAMRVSRHDSCMDGETHVYFESCDGAKEVTLTSECHNEDSLGRMLDVTMTLCNVCPGRRCAVGMQLTELDDRGNEYQRGFRAITVPAHNASQNRDVALPAVRFILPEDVAVNSGNRRRHFVVRTTNHYMDEPACGWSK